MLFLKNINVEVKKIQLDKNYPMIKCNINPTTKEKIYHLPFDQQYDKTIIIKNSGEFYAKDVKEAVSKAEAADIKKQLEEAGATVDVK